MCLIKRLPVTLDRERTAQEVIEHYELNVHEACIILDHVNSGQYPDERYEDPAFCVDPTQPSINPISPPEIQIIFGESNCKQLIWVSREIVESFETSFIWALSHELQHARQNLLYPELHLTNRFICSYYSQVFRVEPYLIDIPIELDAEISAMASIETLRGEETLNQHLDAERNRNHNRREYIDNLLQRKSGWPGVIEATRSLLFARKQRLVHILEQQHAHGRHTYLNLEWILEG